MSDLNKLFKSLTDMTTKSPSATSEPLDIRRLIYILNRLATELQTSLPDDENATKQAEEHVQKELDEMLIPDIISPRSPVFNDELSPRSLDSWHFSSSSPERTSPKSPPYHDSHPNLSITVGSDDPSSPPISSPVPRRMENEGEERRPQKKMKTRKEDDVEEGDHGEQHGESNDRVNGGE
jgi:hypothetical protein